MQSFPPKDKRLLYRYEVMSARLGIRDFFMQTVVQEVYENVGQVLSVVRMQLGAVSSRKTADMGSIASSGNLVEQSIRDLRKMCRSFYPDTDILTEEGFIHALEYAVATIFPGANGEIALKGQPRQIEPGLRLIIFELIHEILLTIKEMAGAYKGLVISYAKQKVTYTISWSGDEVDLNKAHHETATATGLTPAERVQLIEGSLDQKKTKGNMQLKLITPLTVFLK